jgi:hypothetical protein
LIKEDAEVDVTGTLTIAGTLKAEGELTVGNGGKLNNDGTIEVAKELTIENGSEVTNTRIIEVTEGGLLTITAVSGGSTAPTVTNTGTILVKAGATITGNNITVAGTGYTAIEAGGTAKIGSTVFIGPQNDTTAYVNLTDGTFRLNETSYILEGEAALRTAIAFVTPALTLKPGSVLTLNAAYTLGTNGPITSDSPSNPAKIVVGSSGSIVLSGGTSNFYNASGNLQSGTISGSSDIKTYVWNGSGWRLQQ